MSKLENAGLGAPQQKFQGSRDPPFGTLDCESEIMTRQQKSDLIQKDPVTCARSFQHMVQLFIKDVLKSDEMSIGK